MGVLISFANLRMHARMQRPAPIKMHIVDKVYNINIQECYVYSMAASYNAINILYTALKVVQRKKLSISLYIGLVIGRM